MNTHFQTAGASDRTAGTAAVTVCDSEYTYALRLQEYLQGREIAGRVAVFSSRALLEKLQQFVAETPLLRRRVLFMRQDDAPLKHLRGQYRAQVLAKLLEHPDSRAAIEYMQRLAGEEWPCDVLLEINPASMA